MSGQGAPVTEPSPEPAFRADGFAAFLFDMDGTLLTSAVAAERVWRRWAISRGIDPRPLIAEMHGVRAIDTVRRFGTPGMDTEAETAWIVRAEIEDVGGIDPVAGAMEFLRALPEGRWAIATSAPLELARRRLKVCGLPVPRTMITAEDVETGKPAPDCYLAAARALGVDATDCLVWEDAPAGIAAAEAAGAGVMVISASRDRPLDTPHATVHDYLGLRVAVRGDGRLVLGRATPG